MNQHYAPPLPRPLVDSGLGSETRSPRLQQYVEDRVTSHFFDGHMEVPPEAEERERERERKWGVFTSRRGSVADGTRNLCGSSRQGALSYDWRVTNVNIDKPRFFCARRYFSMRNPRERRREIWFAPYRPKNRVKAIFPSDRFGCTWH